jgi:hypothetical protein
LAAGREDFVFGLMKYLKCPVGLSWGLDRGLRHPNDSPYAMGQTHVAMGNHIHPKVFCDLLFFILIS